MRNASTYSSSGNVAAERVDKVDEVDELAVAVEVAKLNA